MKGTFWRIWAALLLSSLLVTAAWAQSDLIKDLDSWSAFATETETALDSGESTANSLGDLRDKIVDFRAEFDAATEMNAARIATLREQLSALGAIPEGEGAVPEAPDVAAKRAELNEQLTKLLVPVQRAEAEFVRANALIGQIDQDLRDRQTQELISTTPSPLNPAHWQPALRDISLALERLWAEPSEDRTQNSLREDLPVTLVLSLIGIVLILRGRHWSQMIVSSLRRLGARGLGIWRFLASLLRIVLPFAGLLVLALAVISTGYFGRGINEIILLAAVLSGVMLGVRWVSERVFSRDDDEALILLPEHKRRNLRFHVSVITALIVAAEILSTVFEAIDAAPTSQSVAIFPITLLASLSLYWIGGILRSYEDPKLVDPEDTARRESSLVRVVRGIGTGAIAVAVVSPLLAAAGYFQATGALLPPYIMTMAVLGLVMTLQRFAADVYGAVTRQGTQAREALMPVLFGLILLVLSAPVLALIWGAQTTDLTELWAAFMRGIALGDTVISPSVFLAFALIFVIGYVLTRLLQSVLRNNVLPKTRIDIGAQNAMVSGLGYVGIFLAALAAITGAGIDLSSLAIVAGALSVGIGFGLQNIVSNFVSGIILLIERPISEGDWIEVGGQMGYVRDISVRSTRIETFDKTDVIVPNADLISGTVTNFTRGNTVGRVIVPVGVAYGSDTKQVEGILREIAESHPMVLLSPPPSVLLLNFGADALEFEVRCVLRDVNFMMVVKNDINHEIVARFTAAGIEIPFAQRDVWLRNPETLRPEMGGKTNETSPEGNKP